MGQGFEGFNGLLGNLGIGWYRETKTKETMLVFCFFLCEGSSCLLVLKANQAEKHMCIFFGGGAREKRKATRPVHRNKLRAGHLGSIGPAPTPFGDLQGIILPQGLHARSEGAESEGASHFLSTWRFGEREFGLFVVLFVWLFVLKIKH